jgi:hypothetical protein
VTSAGEDKASGISMTRQSKYYQEEKTKQVTSVEKDESIDISRRRQSK